MYKDPTDFRDRFNQYKNGKMPYENGLPKYDTGTVPKNKFDAFVEKMGPYLYSSLKRAGVKNIEGAYRNMMRQLALESSYGLSQQAIKNNNFGGVGYNGSTYHKYKSHQDFIDAYVKLMTTRYADSLLLNDPRQYAKAVYDKGYYRSEENTPKANAELLAKYQRDMSNMPSLNSALESHIKNNPNLYNSSFIRQSAQNMANAAMNKYYAERPMINGGNAPMAITENTGDGKVMYFEPGFWGEDDPRLNQPLWMPKEPRAVDYSIGERAPESISSWNDTNSPAEKVHMPDLKQEMDRYNAMMDIFGWNNDSKKKFGLPPLKSLLPSLDEMLQDQTKEYVRDILQVPQIQPLGNFKNGKLPKFEDGVIGSIGNWIQDKTNQVQEGVRNHLYNSVTPIGYNVLNAAKEVLQGHRENNYLAENPFREALFAKYMRQPTFNFQGGSGNTSDWLVESPYLPSLGTVAGGKAYRLNPELVQKYSDKWKLNYLDNDKVKRYFQERAKQGKNNILIDDGSSDLGTYTMGSGRDKNGYFISVYDHWGLQPGEGKDANALLQKASGALGIKDDIMQPVINTDPFTYYDRRYLTEDEWKALGGYANGKLPGFSNGKIHINPANRGKFNATKKRTGKTTEELTHSKNPLTRKRAIFAQNAKKWKH